MLDLLAPQMGPLHLVAWSYGAQVAVQAALWRSALVRSLFVYEPGLASMVTDAAELALFQA